MRDNPFLKKAIRKLKLFLVFVFVVILLIYLDNLVYGPYPLEVLLGVLFIAILTEEVVFGLLYRINRDLEQYLDRKQAPDLEVSEPGIIPEEETGEILAEIDEAIEDIEDELRKYGFTDEDLAKTKIEYDESLKD